MAKKQNKPAEKQAFQLVKARRQDLVQEIATALQAGYAYDLKALLPDPDPVLQKLGYSFRIYDDVRADAKVSACIESRKAGCLAMQWDLFGTKENATATEVIKQALLDLDMPRLIGEVLDAFLWGFQPLEVTWKYENGLVLPASVVGKPPYWFKFDNANNLRFISKDNPNGLELPAHKFLLAQHHATYTNPYGEKVLSKCFWPVAFKKGGLRWWVTATEKYGTPAILGKLPRGTDPKEIAQFLDNLERLVQDAATVIPNDSAVEILDGNSGRGSSSSSPHKELIDHCNAEIALAIVGQTLSSEVGSTGSYAAAKTHNDVREEIVASDKRMIERVIQCLVEWTFNFNWQGQAPSFELFRESDVDKVLAERDKILYDSGLKFTKAYFMKAYGFAEDDIELDNGPAVSFAAPTKKLTSENYMPKEQSLHELAGDLIQPVINLIEQGQSLEEVRRSIMGLYRQIDTKKLEEALSLAFYMCNVGGCASASR